MRNKISLAFLAFILVLIPLFTGCAGAKAPTVTDLEKSWAIDQIKAYSEVLDAAIAQDGYTLSLAIVVPAATSQERAKELGEAFMRLTKNFALLESDEKQKEPVPGQEIGEGIFDYLITVASPDQTIIVQGAKVRNATHITW
jgi:hypothetical protein